MELVAFSVVVLAVVFLGLAAGALLAEAGVLVPFWRSLAPEAFLAWYQQHARLLLRFFGPLEVASGAFVVGATLLAWLGFIGGRYLLSGSALLTVLVLASFPAYFQAANGRFAAGSISHDEVGAELRRWAAWHLARTILAVLAFILAAVALKEGAFLPSA